MVSIQDTSGQYTLFFFFTLFANLSLNRSLRQAESIEPLSNRNDTPPHVVHDSIPVWPRSTNVLFQNPINVVEETKFAWVSESARRVDIWGGPGAWRTSGAPTRRTRRVNDTRTWSNAQTTMTSHSRINQIYILSWWQTRHRDCYSCCRLANGCRNIRRAILCVVRFEANRRNCTGNDERGSAMIDHVTVYRTVPCHFFVGTIISQVSTMIEHLH